MGEFDLIERIRKRIEGGTSEGPSRLRVGIGDDAAVTVSCGTGEYSATSVDALIEGVHFSRDTFGLEDVGHKALAAGLSDLAAMGVEPGEAYMTLGIPQDLDDDGCMQLTDGLASLAEQTGIRLAGGDITRSSEIILSITVVGYSEEAPVTRANARPGDVLLVTGELGGAAAGLRLLSSSVEPATKQENRLIERQLRPHPRLTEGRMLARAGASAMIDISDGLGPDALHVAESSGCRLVVNLESVPVQAGVEDVARSIGNDPVELAAGGGEDYELLAAIPADLAPDAQSQLKAAGMRVTAIGEVAAGSGVELRHPAGHKLTPRGYDQLQSLEDGPA